ncbi:MAG: TonB family protein [Acidobacteria bacterium]|nr:TonB family protein [Acidobacteriota bacterium]
MLDKLVESKNNNTENKRLSGFLLTTFLTIIAILTVGLIYSLFNQTLAMGNENLDVSTLVAPLTATEQSPPPQSVVKQKTQPTEKIISDIPSRMVNMQKIIETPVKTPDSISVTQNKQQARPDFNYTIDNNDSNPIAAGSGVSGNDNAENLVGLSAAIKPKIDSDKVKIEKPPVLKQTPKAIPAKSSVIKSGGVVNSQAINLVKPVYSSAARAVGAKGEVKVEVTIDEEGRVISANAISGHQLLRDSAVSAAKSSRFTPTTLSNQKVKVTGIIIYNFAIR